MPQVSPINWNVITIIVTVSILFSIIVVNSEVETTSSNNNHSNISNNSWEW